ncbi:hypothetical protein LZ198_28420 [Myxococcus sp. K15C18031901]|uniref:hypothetical protein n=1 Tax=Myxococcus dinghuensis TaxID=2906761 RepID=UPI0020A75AEE|nr:hypothetical protein [Myxococcus dinghuensis]MCP3102808.1 hypothetical protein [Myxococcus dinghuensis]
MRMPRNISIYITNPDVNAQRSYVLGNICLGFAAVSPLTFDSKTVPFAFAVLLTTPPLLVATIACALDGLSSDYASIAAKGLRRAIAAAIILPVGIYVSQLFRERPTRDARGSVAATRESP